ncbi:MULTISPECIES: alpha/beta hydrolase [unclassified Pseudomonas]|uniref:alpha/beta hydrolase n=1 Tax=unclassified Pseudomonas TaxID=196821 RepID=UPI000BC490DA|nr:MULTISPECIES: alpha/beta hydrolase [unclassified Pseudomonas]PVZ20675.1 acetyl esterase/lipase [Pseudomonas sp. URIL14HWK12:I12]PVZ27741.1 acetyl esterase/lipase [Pseudomonas sp. URIL14HWK12:I10]PVZ38630.1 acetyl esterase/lipase [Pseudomonas sp. URIL14HWK12:I11]SNZ02592.1 Acetyl esterase/lipase [Pseudomonas sp. URIL14HWK12:I9]
MTDANTLSPPIGVQLPARLVPFPTSISEAARAALQRWVTSEGTPANALQQWPPANDRGAWQALKNRVNNQYATAVLGLAKQLYAQVETLSVGDATLHLATPDGQAGTRRACIDLHGGALVFGGGEACRVSAQQQADRFGACCYGVDYRLPPEHPYPAGLDDCLRAYRHVLALHSPGDIVLIGRSAGGNLALAMLLRARDEGLPMPAGLVLLSPEADLTESGDSFQTNRHVDVMLPLPLMPVNRLYAGGADLAHPYLSPLFGQFDGLPPTFLQSGTRDLFLSNAARLHRGLRRAKVPVEFYLGEGMPHGGFMGATAEDEELEQAIREFVDLCWRP